MTIARNLFAACLINGTLVAKRVSLNSASQEYAQDIFTQQEIQFRQGVDSEIDFDGTWNPDEDEFLTIPIPNEAKIFEETIAANAVSVDKIDFQELDNGMIKALFIGSHTESSQNVLVQRFIPSQILHQKRAFFLSGDSFDRLSDPAFALDSSLTCIIEDSRVKFKSYHKLRSVIPNMMEVYLAATDQEVRGFAIHPNLQSIDVDRFVENANQPIRKAIREVLSNRVLDTYTPSDIKARARATNLNIYVEGGKLVVPTVRTEIKAFLQFLNECRYSGPLSDQTFITNSRRRA